MEMKRERERDKESGTSSRRNFLKHLGTGIGAVSISSIAGAAALSGKNLSKSGKTIKLLTPEGKLVEVDKDDIMPPEKREVYLKAEAKKGLAGHKFVMVIDLAKCKNARKCIEACQEGH